jgi:hypothetical protein
MGKKLWHEAWFARYVIEKIEGQGKILRNKSWIIQDRVDIFALRHRCVLFAKGINWTWFIDF